MSNPLYPELPPGEFIRVLDLHPGSGDDELVGELRTTELGKTAYTALSYVCGNTALTHSIVVSGHKLGIYKNACELLTRFRDPTEVVTVWIDGICINQNDAVSLANFATVTNLLLHNGLNFSLSGATAIKLLC